MSALHLQLAHLLALRPHPGPTRAAAPASAQTPLVHGEVRRVALQSGQSLACRRGCLWVTADGDPRDHVIDAGQRFAPAVAVSVLAYALEDADFAVETA